MKAAYFLLCEKAIQDKNSNKNSFIDVYDKIIILKGVEQAYRDLVVVAKLIESQKGEFVNVKIRILHEEDSAELCKGELEGPSSGESVNLIFHFHTIKIDKVGKYFFDVEVNDSRIDTGNFFFQVLKEE